MLFLFYYCATKIYIHQKWNPQVLIWKKQDCTSKVPFWSKSTLVGYMTIHLSTFLISSLYTELHTTYGRCICIVTYTRCVTHRRLSSDMSSVMSHKVFMMHALTGTRTHAVYGCWLWWWGLVLCRRDSDDLSLVKLMFENADVHKRGTLTREQVYIRQSAFLLQSIVHSQHAMQYCYSRNILSTDLSYFDS